METGGYALLKNVRLLHPDHKSVENCDIFFSQRSQSGTSRILQIGQNLSLPEDQPIKLYAGASRSFCKAFIDTACYIPNRGGRYGETYVSAVRAALSGGFSTVCLLPSPGNSLDTPQSVAKLVRESNNQDVRFLPIASLVAEDRGRYHTVDCSMMKKAGAIALTFPENKPVPQLLRMEAMELAAREDMVVFCPVAGNPFSEMGQVNKGRIAKLLHVRGIPGCGELLSLSESILLAEESGCRIHVPVISLAKSVQYVRDAKKRGVKITCGTAAQYFSLTEDDLIFRGVNAKLDPPLRSAEDRAAIAEGLCDGTIDCITSDHRPSTKEEKGSDIASGAFGAAGLETAFAAGFTFLVLTGKMDLYTLLQKFTTAPASILGLSGTPCEGGRMDLVMIDEEKEMIYTNNTLRGRAINTPYYGMALRGDVDGRYIL